MDIVDNLPRSAGAIVCAMISACASTPKSSDGFVPSESFFAASQNCDALQEVSDQHCGSATFAAYCVWNFSYEPPALSIYGFTELPIYTCETAGDIATQRAADEDKLLCELKESPYSEIESCDSLDTGNVQSCSPWFTCYRQ